MGNAGTKDDPWQLKTPPLTSDYEMYLDEKDGTKVIVCVVGKTTLLYDARAIDDLHAMLAGERRLGGARERRRAEAGEGRDGRGLGALGRQSGRRLVRAEEGPPRTVRDVHAAAARDARARGGRAQPAEQPDAGGALAGVRVGRCGVRDLRRRAARRRDDRERRRAAPDRACAEAKTMRFASNQKGALSSPAIVVRRFCELPFGAPIT